MHPRYNDAPEHPIRTARLALKMQVQELATHLQVTPLTIWRWERGIDSPTREHTVRLALVLEQPAAALVPAVAAWQAVLAVGERPVLRQKG